MKISFQINVFIQNLKSRAQHFLDEEIDNGTVSRRSHLPKREVAGMLVLEREEEQYLLY